MAPTTTPPPTVDQADSTNDDYDYYVNAVLFGATITCYALLLFLFCYFLWKLVRSALDHIRNFYSSHKQGLDSSVPYKGMKEDKLPTVAVIIPVAADNGSCAHQKEPMRNPFWGPLHARAGAPAVA